VNYDWVDKHSSDLKPISAPICNLKVIDLDLSSSRNIIEKIETILLKYIPMASRLKNKELKNLILRDLLIPY